MSAACSRSTIETMSPVLLLAATLFLAGCEADNDATSTPVEPATTTEAGDSDFTLNDIEDEHLYFDIASAQTPEGSSYGGSATLHKPGVDTIIHAGWQTEPTLDDFAAWAGPGLPCSQDGQQRLCIARAPVDLDPEPAVAGIVVYSRQENGNLEASWYRHGEHLLTGDLPGGGTAVPKQEQPSFAGSYCVTYTHPDGEPFPSMELVINPADTNPKDEQQFELQWWMVEPNDGTCGKRTGNAPALQGVGMKLDERNLTSAWGNLGMELQILVYHGTDNGLQAPWYAVSTDGMGQEELTVRIGDAPATEVDDSGQADDSGDADSADD